jgi:hypothetical protein
LLDMVAVSMLARQVGRSNEIEASDIGERIDVYDKDVCHFSLTPQQISHAVSR